VIAASLQELQDAKPQLLQKLGASLGAAASLG
jgi:hypothetical protein